MTGCSFILPVKSDSLSKRVGGGIHVHHLKPLSEIGEKYRLDPVKDSRPVCPNCHAMIHQKSPPYSIEEIIDLLQGEIK